MKFNKRFFNWSVWVTLLLTYILPYQSTDGFATKYGYPFSFFTVYNTKMIKISLLSSNSINALLLAIDILIVYFVIYAANELLNKRRSDRNKNPIENS